MHRVLRQVSAVVTVVPESISLFPISSALSNSSPKALKALNGSAVISSGVRSCSTLSPVFGKSGNNYEGWGPTFGAIRPLLPGSLLYDQKRQFWGKEGRPGWRRRRAREHREREKILEPNTPLIDQKFPWPKDDTESLPPGLFGEDVEVLSPEEILKRQNAIVGRINNQLEQKSEGRLFAVVQVCGKQFKVTAEDMILVQHNFPPTNGDQIRFNKVLLAGGKDFTLVGRPLLDPELVRVEATVIEKTKSYAKMVFRMKKRSNFRRLDFVKDDHTMLRINLVELMQPISSIKSESESIAELNK